MSEASENVQGSPWSTINALITALDAEFVHGQKQARIIEAVAYEAATRTGYPLESAITCYENLPWVAEGLRRAKARIDEESSNGESAGVFQDRDPGGDAPEPVQERVAVGGAGGPRPARGRRGSARAGADQSDA